MQVDSIVTAEGSVKTDTKSVKSSNSKSKVQPRGGLKPPGGILKLQSNISLNSGKSLKSGTESEYARCKSRCTEDDYNDNETAVV